MAVDTNLTEGLTLFTGTLIPDMLDVCMQPPLVYVVSGMFCAWAFFMVKKAITRR